MTSSADARPTLLDAAARDGVELSVEGDAYRHLFRARRLAVGDALRVVDGAGGAWTAHVESVGPQRGTVRLREPEPSREQHCRLELLVALPRSQRASWLVEKATEIGVAALRFLLTERTVREAGRGTLERWGRVAAAALEQCGRSRLPEVTGPHEWREIEELLAPCTARFVLDPGGPAPPRPAPEARGGSAVLVGPEGGWTDAERRRLDELGARPVGLGPTVLRTETAALAAAALWLLGSG